MTLLFKEVDDLVESPISLAGFTSFKLLILIFKRKLPDIGLLLIVPPTHITECGFDLFS